MPKKESSYQDVSDALDAVLLRMQQPDIPVDEAVALYKQGLTLAAELEKYLEQAENTIKQLTLQAAGQE
jgi:exodeoxyribonuclease VII small subunit